MTAVSLSRIEKHYGDVHVLKDINIEIADREFMVFVGPSGCGKSTLLRSIAGLEEISAGRILIGEVDVTQVEPAHRGVAMVFQSYALFPHMSAFENIAFGLRMAKMAEAEIRERVAEAAGILQIEALLKRKPRELSGGQRQRVAIGRAIVRHPKVFLFDEPLSNLDAALRVQMRLELIRLHQKLDATMIYVTHDQIEAMTMADRIVVLNGGRVEQIGTPLEIYRRPRNRFVAGFIGSPQMNFLPVMAEATDAGGVTVCIADDTRLRIPVRDTAADGAMTLGIRPEHIEITVPGDGLTGETLVVEHLGGETLLHVRLADDNMVTVKAPADDAIRQGDRLGLGLSPQQCHLFGVDGQALERLDSGGAPVANPAVSA